MSGRLETPVDATTGLPACFFPPDSLPPPPQGQANLDRRGDWNHQFPKFEVMSNQASHLDRLGRLALMNLWKQWVDFDQHHNIYNEQYVGPKQPLTEAALAKTAVFGLAGAVGELAIDLSKPESQREIKISDDRRRQLWESGQVRVVDPGSVKNFLFRFVLEQDTDHINPDKIYELLKTQDHKRRLYLAHTLSAKIVERAVEPFADDYAFSREKGLLHPSAPNNVRDFVKPRLAVGKRNGRVLDAMFKKLAADFKAQQGIELAA